MKGEMTQTACTRSRTHVPPRPLPRRAPPLNSRSSPPLRETCSAQVTAQGPPARSVLTNTPLSFTVCQHVEPIQRASWQPHVHKHHSLIYIRHTSFTSVLILSEIINFRGEINILSFRVAVLTSSLFNSLTNKHSRVHRGLRCLFHLISCFTLSFVLPSFLFFLVLLLCYE